MDLAQAYIFDLGFIFFAAWGAMLAALIVIAFGPDLLSLANRKAFQESSSHPR